MATLRNSTDRMANVADGDRRYRGARSTRWRNACSIRAFIAGAILTMITTHVLAQAAPGIPDGASAAVVSLPMYEESDAVKKADDIFWARLREKLAAEGIVAPVALARTDADLMTQWQDNHLLLSQTCGYPFTHNLMQQGIKIVGTPVYTTNAGLPAGEYRSVIIVRADSPYKTLTDLKGKKAGVNDMGSNSGMNAFRATVAAAFPESELKQGIFSSVVVTDGHMKSVRMVGDGELDVAAIDSVTYDLIKRDHPEVAAKTRVLTETPASPGLPMITSSATDDATIQKIRHALKDLITHPDDAKLRWALNEMKLSDFVVIDAPTYHQRIYQLEDAAINKGYPILK